MRELIKLRPRYSHMGTETMASYATTAISVAYPFKSDELEYLELDYDGELREAVQGGVDRRRLASPGPMLNS